MTTFDYPTWAAQGRANADKLPSAVAEALGPERDWADDLVRELWPIMSDSAANDKARILRTRCQPIGNDTVTDGVGTFLPRMMEEWSDAVAKTWGRGSQTHGVARDGVAIVLAALKKATQ